MPRATRRQIRYSVGLQQMDSRMRTLSRLATALLLAAQLTACEQAPLPSADPATQLIENVIVFDGTGVAGNRILAVGDLERQDSDIVIDGGGRALAPGFIDTHSHADTELFEQPGALAAVSQGITTVVVGQDGFSPFPLLDFRMKLLDHPIAVNIAAYSGHNTLREHVMKQAFRRHLTCWRGNCRGSAST